MDVKSTSTGNAASPPLSRQVITAEPESSICSRRTSCARHTLLRQAKRVAPLLHGGEWLLMLGVLRLAI